MVVSGNNNRIGLSLIAAVLCLYTFGLIETVWHLPEASHSRLQVGNINLSVHGISDVATDDDEHDEEADEEDDNNDPIPPARWPISIRDEDGNLEEVIHPGHKTKGTFKCCIQISFNLYLNNLCLLQHSTHDGSSILGE